MDGFLNIPNYLIRGPGVFIYLIIPLILFSYALKCALDRIRIFHSSTVNWIIGFIIAISTLFLISVLAVFIVPVSIFIICLTKFEIKKGIIFGIIGGIIYWIIIAPLLMNLF